MRLRTLLVPVVVAGLAASAGSATAAPKKKPKPITKTYTVTAPVPMPYPLTGDPCSAGMQDLNEDREPFKAPAPGTLTITVTEFTGDWDIGLFDSANRQVAAGGGVDTPSTQTGTEKETLKYKIRKKGTYNIDVCNFLGGSTGKVTYKFEYA